ncbi:F0F1 ATP synthase subunit epsilon [Thermotoga sp. KOL6]|uniref:F0F1 ATP synthase subunit epsilon n=1 Tax=Thermotoga sp. KOL6 TaxID=126741 RepID=UPI000C781B62|nr:F0F1 ATP synthase subunit epsilon [Thermotoga sp. KOL6]PLV60260.1 ATP synthase F0F1 subunit epsilon [Thermotoga sp. KOL6]
MKVKIVTPYGTVYDKESDFVSFRTIEGAMGILPKRAPIVAQLSVCDVKVKSGEEEYHLKVAGGFLRCDGKEVIIITEEAGKEEDISPDRFMEARERVERVRKFFQSL